MDEPRDTQPGQEARAPIAAAKAILSPLQQAWSRFVRHVTVDCARCRDIDQTRCDDADRLYRAWREQADAALDAVAGETA